MKKCTACSEEKDLDELGKFEDNTEFLQEAIVYLMEHSI